MRSAASGRLRRFSVCRTSDVRHGVRRQLPLFVLEVCTANGGLR